MVGMACCRCCCGNVDCEEGQQGKCCCGGPGGACCQEGQYCCDGVCQAEECGIPCEEGADCPEDKPHCCNGYCQAEPCPVPCANASDCPNYGLACADFFPDVPYNCCGDECEPHACYPGAQITLNFRKKTGCPVLGGIADEEEFDVVISGGSIGTCGTSSADLSGAPCLTEWTLGEDCAVTNLTFAAGGIPNCAECYEFLGWTSCRLDCAGVCA